MFIKYTKGYVNTDKIRFFTIKPNNYNDPTEYAIFGKTRKEHYLIKQFETEEAAEKHLKKLIEKINAK